MLLLALLGLQGTVHSAERSQFHQLPLDSSLAQNTVTDIVQDQRGLLWVGTLGCLLYTSPSPRDRQKSRMPSSA